MARWPHEAQNRWQAEVPQFGSSSFAVMETSGLAPLMSASTADDGAKSLVTVFDAMAIDSSVRSLASWQAWGGLVVSTSATMIILSGPVGSGSSLASARHISTLPVHVASQSAIAKLGVQGERRARGMSPIAAVSSALVCRRTEISRRGPHHVR